MQVTDAGSSVHMHVIGRAIAHTEKVNHGHFLVFMSPKTHYQGRHMHIVWFICYLKYAKVNMIKMYLNF